MLAFSFALTVSKEKAVYDLDLITNQVDFKNIRENSRRGFSLILRFSLKIIKFALLWLCVLCSHKFDSLPCVKGGGTACRDGGIVKTIIHTKQSLSQLR